jgi:hypothetical protein
MPSVLIASPAVPIERKSASPSPRRRFHRWGIKSRISYQLSIKTCERCGLVCHSRHMIDPDANEHHWKEYYTEAQPDNKLSKMPECIE